MKCDLAKLSKYAILGAALWVGPAYAQNGDVPGRTGPLGQISFPDARTYCPSARNALYASCGSQIAILNAARARATREDKHLLVILGADWCGWCRVLDSTLEGAFSPAQKDTSNQRPEHATELSQYVAQNLVVARINVDRVDHAFAMASIGVNAITIEGVPRLYLYAEGDRRSLELDASPTQLDNLRGYDRAALLRLLRDSR